MFVLSLKTSKKKLLGAGAILIAAIFIIAAAITPKSNSAQVNSAENKVTYNAATDAERVTFAKQFGWEVKPEPVETQEVLIPDKFDSVYEKYNRIQKKQGLNLIKYRNKTCTRYSYEVTNYPGYTEGVRMNMLVIDSKVVGGDVCSLSLNGFMHGFAMPKGNE